MRNQGIPEEVRGVRMLGIPTQYGQMWLEARFRSGSSGYLDPDRYDPLPGGRPALLLPGAPRRPQMEALNSISRKSGPGARQRGECWVRQRRHLRATRFVAARRVIFDLMRNEVRRS